MKKEQADQILAALPWRCYHCDFVTSNPDEAEAHFGDRDDAEEFKPLCKWWDRMDAGERISTLQDTIRELNSEQRQNMSHRVAIDGLEYQVDSGREAFSHYKPFKKCTSMYEVFCEYDSLEGRLLAAEERLKVLIEAVNDAGFKIMLGDDGKTFLKPDQTTIGIPAEV